VIREWSDRNTPTGDPGTFAASFLRFSFATLFAVYLLWHFRDSGLLWGDQGIVDLQILSASANVDHMTKSIALFLGTHWSVAYWLAIITALIFAAGILPRIFACLFAISVHYMFFRTLYAVDGGLKIMADICCYLVITDTSRYFRLIGPRPDQNGLRWLDRLFHAIHPIGMFCIAMQICIIYYWSGFYKITGSDWQHGIAVQRILQSDRFSTPFISEHIAPGMACVVLNYATLLFQGAMPFLMWVKSVKPYLIALAIIFHVCIGALMGLVFFSLIMIVVDLSLLEDTYLIGAYNVLADLLGIVRVYLSGFVFRRSQQI